MRLSFTLNNLIWLDIAGGEPTIRNDLLEIVNMFNFKELSIPTNCWNVERVVRKLTQIYLEYPKKLIVTLSLEGFRDTHDNIREKGSFIKILEVYERLRKLKYLRIKFNTVLSSQNKNEVIDLAWFVKSLNPAYHSILLLRGQPRDPKMKLPSLPEIKSILMKFWEIQRTYNYGRIGLMAYLHRKYQYLKIKTVIRTLEEKKQVIPCLAGRKHLVVWSDGGVSPCELMLPLGNIHRSSLSHILTHSHKFQSKLRDISDGECYCTHDCNMVENILYQWYPLKLINLK